LTKLRKFAPSVIKALLLAIIIYFIVRNIPLKLSDLTSFLAHANGWFYTSMLLFSVFLMLQASIWVLIVNASLLEGIRLRNTSKLQLLSGLQIFINSQFAKYIPGGIWNYAGRIVLATRAGVPFDAQFASIVYENVLLVAAALAYTIILFVDLNVAPVLLIIGGLAIFALIYSYYPRLSSWVRELFVRASRWKLLRRLVDKFTKSFGTQMAGGLSVSLSRNRFFGYFLCFLGSHFIMGISFWMLTNSFGQSDISILFAAGTFATAWLIGLLSPLPGGLGVREGFLVYFLSMKVGTETAIQISVIARLWNMMAEVLFWMLVQAVSYLTRRVKVYET
jgi:uncharacterized protein (TIRG00374 family)